MAVDPQWLADRVHQHGPSLYHVCQDEAGMAAALRDGLVPASRLGFSPYETTGEPAYMPRPDHSYLCTQDLLPVICGWYGHRVEGAPIVEVDVWQLAPADINPDEDGFFEGWLTYELRVQPVYVPELPHPNDTVNDWRLISAGQDVTVQELAARPYASYGDWAEGVDLGSVAEHTHACWEQVGSVAVRGGVPASALRPRDAVYAA